MASSRTGQKIARRACDLCRKRKIKCKSDDPSLPCDGCIELHVPCTFNNHQRRRGRPHRTLERFLSSRHSPCSDSHIASPILPHLQSISTAIHNITPFHLCPLQTFELIIDDYLALIYPITPITHRPSFTHLLSTQAYTTDPSFLRLCLAICAMTVSSLQRRMPKYGFSHYLDAKEMVKRADELVTASRLCDSGDNISVSTMISSLLLGMACHYTEQPTRGWILINESIQCCRFLRLGERRGYVGKTSVETEICKRSFWMLYIIQIHDRLSHLTPDTLLGQDPTLTDWEFLMPAEINDENLSAGPDQRGYGHNDDETPLISGFVSLIKVFLCVIGLLNEDHSQAPSPNFTSAIISLSFCYPKSIKLRNNSLQNATLDHGTILRSLKDIVLDFPAELQGYTTCDIQTKNDTELARQFEIMKANIHITRLYLMSSILESSTNFVPNSRGAIISIWHERENICRLLLEVVRYCPLQTLESNGTSMVVKIREIASTLLTQSFNAEDTEISLVASASKAYIKSFIGLLAELDVPAEMAVKAKQASTSPMQTLGI